MPLRCESMSLKMITCFGLLFLCSSTAAQKCSWDHNQPPQHIFANPDGKSDWREYETFKEVPELHLDSGSFAKVWSGRDGKTHVSMQDLGEDFNTYADYCFDASGQLISLKYQLRTAWGWGYRTEGLIRKGVLVPSTEEFFSTQSGARIAKPEQAEDIHDALKPQLYLHKSQLPFFKVLSSSKVHPQPSP